MNVVNSIVSSLISFADNFSFSYLPSNHPKGREKVIKIIAYPLTPSLRVVWGEIEEWTDNKNIKIICA